MNRKIFYLSFFVCLTTILPVNAYQIASNHSYVKNSEFTTNYDIKIEGYGDFKGMLNSYKNTETTNLKNSSTIFENEVSINVNLDGELDEITKYGIKFIQTFNNNFSKEKEYYSYLYGYYGRLELGNTISVAEHMRIGADTIALGSGGISGNFTKYITLAGDGSSNSAYILSPGVLTSQNFGYYNDSINRDFWDNSKYLTKVNFYSPEFYNFQIGASIIPNVYLKPDNIGNIDSGRISNKINLGTFIDYGLSYINTFDNLGVALSVVGEQNISNSINKTDGESEDITNKFKSLELGCNINYFGLTAAGSVGRTERNVEEDLNLSPITQKKGKYLTYGVSYELDEFSFSVTFFNSEYKDYTKFKSYAFAIENKMSKNISMYAEYINFTSTFEKNTKKEKEGYNIMLGFLLNFN